MRSMHQTHRVIEHAEGFLAGFGEGQGSGMNSPKIEGLTSDGYSRRSSPRDLLILEPRCGWWYGSNGCPSVPQSCSDGRQLLQGLELRAAEARGLCDLFLQCRDS